MTTYSDLHGKKAHPQTIKKILRKLKRGSVISNLAIINALFLRISFFGHFEKDFPKLQEELNENYLRESVIADIQRNNNQNNPVFSRLQAIFLAQLSILNCSEDANLLADGKTEGGFDLGDSYLMASDYLLSQKEDRNINTGTNKKRIRHLGFQLAPLIDFSNPLDIILGIIRSEIIYSQILASDELKETLSKKDLSHFDIAKEFETSTKISLLEYIDITLAILFTFLSPEEQKSREAQFFTLSGFLRYSTLDEQILKRFLKLEAKKPEEFKKIFNNNKSYLKQFSYLPFKTFSMIEIIDGIYICIDPFFLSEKLSSGIYWKIFDSLRNEKQRNDFFQVYGYIFEQHVRQMLRQITSKNGYFVRKGLQLSSPTYQNNDESFDEMIYYPESKHLIVFECKSSFMHTEAKYGNSIRKFEKEIRKKFVAKEDSTGKGIGQFANHISKLFHKDKGKRLHLNNPEFDKYIQNAEKISPVLITQEPIISLHIIENFLNSELNKKLQKQTLRASAKVSQLTVIDIETLERLKPYLATGEPTLEQCINSRIFRDPTYKQMFRSFLLSNFTELNQKKKNAENDELLNKVFQRIKERFFYEKIN
jgi:hypothetical protein